MAKAHAKTARVLADLTEEECYLLAILQDQSGIDPAEFSWRDETSPDGLFRCWDFQYGWYRCTDKQQIDQCARAIGKSVGIQMRAWAFAFANPQKEMLITAPELIHLDPVTAHIEDRILGSRLSKEFLKTDRTNSNGIKHRPFEVNFRNGAKIIGRIPQKDGKGVKGCIAEGTMVLTRRGMVAVEDVVAGDLVFTHRHRWKRVQGIYSFENVDGVEVAGGGHRGLTMSSNHRMLARRNRNPQRRRRLEPADWLIVGEDGDASRHYLGSPCEFPPDEVPWERFIDDMAWVVGRYVADGHLTWAKKAGTRTSARVHVIVDAAHREEVTERFVKAGLRPTARLRTFNGTYDIEASDTNLAGFLEANFGRHADGKSLPSWLLGVSESTRRAFLDGYLSGDGHYESGRGRWTAGTASRALAVGLRLLAQTLGMSSGLSWVDPKVTAIAGRELVSAPKRSWRVTMTEKRGIAYVEDGSAWQKVRRLTPVEIPVVYDLRVEDDHSYLADGLYSHNMHPHRLEQDEAQDYPEPGWTELGSTLKFADSDAIWRAHGVSRGVRDMYYSRTQKESGWTVHRFTAMHRPDWSAGERAYNVEYFGGSKNSPDYRRNVLGLHGDAQSPLFVLSELMACVDIKEESDYNSLEYYHVEIRNERLEDSGLDIVDMLDFPESHKAYDRVWVGMDVGLTNHPTEILIAGEETLSRGGGEGRETGKMRLKVIARIHLERISSPLQRKVLGAIYDFYRPKGIAMDRTGLGLPIWQEIQLDPDTPAGMVKVMRPYNFSEKIIVGFEKDDRDEDAPYDPDWEPTPIMGNVLEYSSDMLRYFVSKREIKLPYDTEMLREFQGQTYATIKTVTDPYGKKKFNVGKFHALDAARMLILGHLQEFIEAMKEVEEEEAVLDMFLTA